MASGYHLLQLRLFRFLERASSTPREVIGPLVADQGDQVRRGLVAEIAGASVERAEARCVFLDEPPWSSAAQDGCHGPGPGYAVEMGGKKGVIPGKEPVQDRVGLVPIGLDVNEQDKTAFVGVDVSAVCLDPLGEGFEIQFLQSPVLTDTESSVGHMEFISAQEDVSLDAAESMGEGIQERSLVVVVVVGMSPCKGSDYLVWEGLFILCP